MDEIVPVERREQKGRGHTEFCELAVGLADNFGKALFPEISYFTLYAPMVLILAVKPTGLFGRE